MRLRSVRHWTQYSREMPSPSSSSRISGSMLTLVIDASISGCIVSNGTSGSAQRLANHGCLYTSATVKRRAGSVVSSPASRLRASADTWSATWYAPARIFWYSEGVSGSSKGRKPHSIAKRHTPSDHRSAHDPLYRLPAIISGAA